jgi:hypothetical protein
MSKRGADFNVKAFWESIRHQTCQKRLKGALRYLERKMEKGPTVKIEDMFACKMYLKGKIGKCDV